MSIGEKSDTATASGGSRRRANLRFTILALSPAWLFLAVLIGYPLFKVLTDAFQKAHLVNPSVGGFVGVDNFDKVIADPHFFPAVGNTVAWTVGSVIGEFVIGLAAAVLLNRRLRGQGFFRVITFIPWLVPIIVAGMTWEWMLNPDFGIVNAMLTGSGLVDSPINFLGDPAWAMPTVIFVNVWRSFPYYTISFLAAMQAIPDELYEAARLDGASAWRCFWSVTMPQLRSVSLIIVFIHLIWTAVNFDFIWVMTQGGPNYATMTLPILIYRYSLQQFDVGAASALSTLMLIGTSLIFVVYYRFRRKLSEEIVG
ncbi:carbohydrate ABC transporter permease [Microbacterium sp. SA39]|uniref:carbohydrate ABC transporter permease n=1 Tax=Microbacterium sp. SA39 TaxID=1263625 RepID=UPI0005F9EE9D|nr:sugar ABC transporter permease [Microbacterium sp. SA39]KJQ54499.1 Trehalose transport system permease protein SugA [Microbacterium sp. SA39]